MSDQRIMIDGNLYDPEQMSERCRNMLALVQQTNNSLQILAPLLESARAGADATFADAKKLLPEPLPAEDPQGEEADDMVVN